MFIWQLPAPDQSSLKKFQSLLVSSLYLSAESNPIPFQFN